MRQPGDISPPKARPSKKQGESNFSLKLKNNLHKAFPGSKWWKNHGTEYSERGLTDLMGCVDGRFYAIEVKINKGWFDPHQINWMRVVKKAGGTALGITKENGTVYLIPMEAMGHKGNRHRELWVEIALPGGLTMLEFWE